MMKALSKGVSEWSNLFPHNVSDDYTNSVIYIKRLTLIAVSTITYVKDVLRTDSYSEEILDNIAIHILKKKCRDDLGQFLSKSIMAAFDALDKKHLKQLILCFYNGDLKSENLVESHVFEYVYKDKVSMSLSSNNREGDDSNLDYTYEKVREHTLDLLKAYIVLMNSCQALFPSVSDIGISLRVVYNEDTPLDYHAPGYIVANDVQEHLGHILEPTKMGTIATRFHRLSVVSYIKGHTIDASHEAIASQNPPVLSNDSEKSVNKNSAICGRPPMECPCKKYDDDLVDAGELLTCHYCHTQQHAACFGVFKRTVVIHCCDACHDENPERLPTDRKLVPLEKRKRACLCIFRRSLEYCSRCDFIGNESLSKRFNMSKENTLKLMKMLHLHGVIKLDPVIHVNQIQKINKERLKFAFNKFFNTNEEKVVDNIITDFETFVSQESRQSDPIGDDLTPIEKQYIQSSSNIGQCIEKPVDPVIEDLTINQYKDALVSDEIDVSYELKETRKRIGIRSSVQSKKSKLNLKIKRK